MIRLFRLPQVIILLICVMFSGCSLFGGGEKQSDHKAAIANLEHKDPRVRINGLKELREMAHMNQIPDPGETVSLIMELFDDPDPFVRAWAYSSAAPVAGITPSTFGVVFEYDEEDIRELNERYPVAGELVPHLIEALEDESKVVRIVAVQELMELIPLSREASPALVKVFTDTGNEGKISPVDGLSVGSGDLRALALTTIARIGDVPATITPEVLEFLKEEDECRIQAALEVLERIGPEPGVVDAVKDIILNEDDGGILNWALHTTMSFGVEGAQVIPAIIALRDKDIEASVGVPNIDATIIRTLGSLARYTEDAVPALTAYLEDENSTNRYLATDALSNVGLKPGVIDALLSALEDENPDVRGQAAQGLGRFIDLADTLIPILEGIVSNDESKDVQNRAGFAIDRLKGIYAFPTEPIEEINLEKYKDDPEGLFIELVNRFGEGELLARQYAVNILAEQFPQQAYPVLMDALEDDDPLVRAAVPVAIGKIGKGNPKTIQALMKALDDEERDVRIAAAMGVCLLQEEALVAIPKLLEMLQDEDEVVRGKVAEALGWTGGLAPAEVVPALVAMFGDEDDYPRSMAELSLVSYGDSAVPLLIENLTNKDRGFRYHSLSALDLIVRIKAATENSGEQTEAPEKPDPAMFPATNFDVILLKDSAFIQPAMPLIIGFMGDQDNAIRLKAKEIAIRVSPKQASAKLIELLDVEEVRYDAIRFLREIEPFPTDAFPVLMRLIQSGGYVDADPESDKVHFIEECVFALAEHALDKVEVIEPLIALLSSNQAGIRHAAAWGLGEFGANAAGAVNALAGVLGDVSPDVRYNAALSLGKIGTAATPALPKMQETAANEKNSEVRRVLQEAIQKILLAGAGVG